MLLGLSANKGACWSTFVFLAVIYTYGHCERHVQVGSITSNPWLVLLSFIHCMSVAPLSNRMVC